MVKQCFLCSALGLLLAGWDCTASDGLSLGQLRAQCALQWNSWKQQPWSQQLQRQSSQPQCTSPIYPSIHPSAQTFSKLSMKQHHVSLISNYVSIWCCMHISIFFQHHKLHSIHPPTQVVSKQSGSLILICCQFSSCHIHATSASPKPSVQQQSSRLILQKSICSQHHEISVWAQPYFEKIHIHFSSQMHVDSKHWPTPPTSNLRFIYFCDDDN